MSEHIRAEQRGAALELGIDRPDKKNAFTMAMYTALADGLDAAAGDAAIRVVTIRGGGDVFTAGNDLKDFQAAPPFDPDAPVFRFIDAIARFPKPLIAGVAGAAIGIGTTMLLHCDLVVATPSARFHMPFVDLALVPEAGSSLLFPRLVGRQRAALHLLLAEPFDAETAHRYGLVTRVVAADALDATLRDLADRIAAKPPEAVRLTKRLIADQAPTLADRVAEEGDLFAERLRSAEAAEAFHAFFEKRAPDFTSGG